MLGEYSTNLVATLRAASPRAATALLMVALAAALHAAAMAPAAGAAVIASSRSGFEGGPALASDGRVIVGERRGNGALRILAIDPRTRAATELIAFPPLPDPATYPVLNVSGTGAIVTASLDLFRQADKTDAEQAHPLPQASGTMTILPTLAPLASCSPLLSSFPSLDAAGGEGFVATVGDECAMTASAVRIRTPTATHTIPALPAPATSTFAPQISNLRASGPMLAWLETRMAGLGSPVTSSVVVARGATGDVLLRVPIGVLNLRMGLGSDGTVALSAAVAACVMAVASPAAPSLRTFPLGAQSCSNFGGDQRGQGEIAVAGGRIVYATGFGYGVTDLQGAVHSLAEATLLLGKAAPVAFDGRMVYAVRNDCDADRLLAVDADVPGPRPSGTPQECPVRRSGPARLRVARDGRVTIALRCKAGCRGTLRLLQQRGGRRERLVGRADYGGGAGTVLARPRIARYARALAGCRGGLRAVALLHPVGDDHTSVSSARGKGLGAYRIVSRARCRRTGGPSFTAPRGGPRP